MSRAATQFHARPPDGRRGEGSGYRSRRYMHLKVLAPRAGFEPATNRLTEGFQCDLLDQRATA